MMGSTLPNSVLKMHFKEKSVCPTFQPVWSLLCTCFALNGKYINIYVCVTLLCLTESKPDLLTNVNMSLILNLESTDWRELVENAVLEVISRLFSVIPRLRLCTGKKGEERGWVMPVKRRDRRGLMPSSCAKIAQPHVALRDCRQY